MVSVVQNQMPTTHISPATSASLSVADKKDDTQLISKSLVQDREVDMEKLNKKLNSIAKEQSLDVSFGYDKELNKVYINVVDKNSGEVIRKLPSQEAMNFAKSMKEAVGKLLDKRG